MPILPLTYSKITRTGGIAVVNSDGSITIDPATGTPDGSMGVTMSTPNLGSQGTVTTPQLKIISGNYQQGPALTVRAGLLCQPAFTYIADVYSTTNARVYINDGGGIYTQAWIVSSGYQTAGGTIYPGTNLDSHLDIWTDVRNAIMLRGNTGYARNVSTVMAIKTTETSTITDEGYWIFCMDGNGLLKWAPDSTIPYGTQPYTISTATFGYSNSTGYLETYGASRIANNNANATVLEVRKHASQVAGPVLSTASSAGVVDTAIMNTGEVKFQDSNSAYGIIGLPSWDRTYFYLQNAALSTASAANAALAQSSGGATILNCASGQDLYIRVNNSTVFQANATGIGVNGTAPVAKPNITGSRGGNAALANLLTALASVGHITDSTTA